MELAELKNSWQVFSKEREDKMVVSKSVLESVLKEKAIAAKSKAVRKMSIDAMLMVAINAGLISALYLLDLQFRHVSALIIIAVALILLAHYHIHVMLLQKSALDLPVKESIKKSLNLLQKYYLSYQLLVPIGFGIILLFAYNNGLFIKLGLLESNPTSGIQILSILLFGVSGWVILRLIFRNTIQSVIKDLKSIDKDLSDHKDQN